MANIIQPRTLSGFAEWMPDEQVLFEKVKERLEKTYSSYGFFPLDTPVLEYSEILLAKAGGETEKQIYRFEKGDTDLTMRFDLTVPLAKYVAKNQGELTFPFKRYQIGKVYRGERAQKGRFMEFYQADIDIIGDGSLSIVNDAEIPSIIYNTFTSLGIDDFYIRINNRRVLNGLFTYYGITAGAAEVLRIIDKFDKIGFDSVKAELVELGVAEQTAADLLGLLTFKGANAEVIAKLEALVGEADADTAADTGTLKGSEADGSAAAGSETEDKASVLREGVSELKQVVKYIYGFGVPERFLQIDLTIARGLDYYTGTVYETTITKHPEIGSVCSGGRYDNLAEYYTNKKLPGVGISIGLTRLFYILNESKWLNDKLKSPADVLVIPMTEDVSRAVEVSAGLRASGIRNQVYLEQKKFKAKIGYADKLGIPFCIFLGEDEIAAGQVSLKNMTDGSQVTCGLKEAITTIQSYLTPLMEEKLVNIK